MNIGLIDVDHWGKLKGCFPNLPLMKLSTYYKQNDCSVEWYEDGKDYDLVFKSKVFSFTEDVPVLGDVGRVEEGGTGYSIKLEEGKEIFDKEKHKNLMQDIEHCYPDYALYGITDTAYGFMSRGCPRGCDFCHVKHKEGRCSVKVADLKEFWNGQKKIELLDPNTFACKDWKDILKQLIESGAEVDFNQGVDVRILTDEKISYLKQVRTKYIHFAFDRFQDWDIITKNLLKIKQETGWDKHVVTVYVLTNFDTTIEQDIKRCLFIRDVCGFTPYVMRYDKEHIPRGSLVNALARWINYKPFCQTIPTFDDYLKLRKEGKI